EAKVSYVTGSETPNSGMDTAKLDWPPKLGGQIISNYTVILLLLDSNSNDLGDQGRERGRKG
ncbi:hypothetical protein ACMWQB_31675, partial [Escherichia coli]|uniref:hypothetical protein n=1 Tax=Escherichia coli TaxID=562 RepID=UPI0039E0F8EB